MTDDEPRAAAIRRRDDGVRRLSSITAALAVTSVVGTGAVVYAVAQHSSGAPSSGTQSGTGITGVGFQSPATAPGAAQSAPIVTSHGS